MMLTRSDVLSEYILQAPAPLAIERSLECRLLAAQPFESPIIDIGCGEGLFARMLFCGTVDTGIDPNARELERARELGAYGELICCYGDAVPKPAASYQTAFANSVVEHIPDVRAVLREAHRLLAPGGRLYLTVPSGNFERFTWVSQLLGAMRLRDLQKRYHGFFNRFWRHYHAYPVTTWSDIVRECGFELIEAHSYCPKRVCLMNDGLVPFSLGGLITKRLTNRWTLLPRWARRIVTAPVTALARRVMAGPVLCEDGGLVFLAARKP